MKRILPLIFASWLIVIPAAFTQDEKVLSDKEVEGLSETMKSLIDAWIKDDRGTVLESKNQLATSIQKLESEKKAGDLLKDVNLWQRIREGTIDHSNRVFKRTGKGFQSAEFMDFTEINDREYDFFISLPDGYSPEGKERYPVIIFLHPGIDAKKKPDKEVQKMVKELYSDKDLLENYIILAPVGPVIEEGRKKELVDAGSDWESLEYGRKTAFMAVRILMEQMVFDRERIILDGIGKAGLSAYRYAQWYPSFFAGVVGRDADLAPFIMENLKGIPLLYISTSENEAEKASAARKWAEDYGKGDPPQVTFLEDGGTTAALSEAGTGALKEWLSKVKKNTAPKGITLKTANLETACAYWLKILELNVGLNMSLDDPDYPIITARVDDDSNSIIIDSKRVLRVMLFLNDKILDLDKKVTVIMNGKNRFEGTVSRNLDKMIDILYNNAAGDLEIYTNYLEITEEG